MSFQLDFPIAIASSQFTRTLSTIPHLIYASSIIACGRSETVQKVSNRVTSDTDEMQRNGRFIKDRFIEILSPPNRSGSGCSVSCSRLRPCIVIRQSYLHTSTDHSPSTLQRPESPREEHRASDGRREAISLGQYRGTVGTQDKSLKLYSKEWSVGRFSCAARCGPLARPSSCNIGSLSVFAAI